MPHLLCDPGQVKPPLELPSLVSRTATGGQQVSEAPTTQHGPSKGWPLCSDWNGPELESQEVSCPTRGMVKLKVHIHLMEIVLVRVNRAEARARRERHPGYTALPGPVSGSRDSRPKRLARVPDQARGSRGKADSKAHPKPRGEGSRLQPQCAHLPTPTCPFHLPCSEPSLLPSFSLSFLLCPDSIRTQQET